MKNRFLCALTLSVFAAPAADRTAPAPLEVKAAAGRLLVDGQTGAILGAWPAGGERSVWHSGENGLWRLTFKDGTTLAAADFRTNGCPARIARTDASAVSCTFAHPLADVAVTLVPSAAGVDIQGTVTAKTGNPAMTFDLPARLRFAPQDVDRLYFPQRGNAGLGFALKRGFFEEAPASEPRGWQSVRPPRNGYAHVFGGNVTMRPLEDEPVPVTVTDFGRTFLPAETIRWIETRSPRHRVNRACKKGQFDRSLADSPHGPFISGSSFGGTGMLWRFGTTEHPDPAMKDDRIRLAKGILAGALKERRRPCLGLLRLRHGPYSGSFTGGIVEDYHALVRLMAEKTGFKLVELTGLEALGEALDGTRFQAILSPYGEAFPAQSAADFLPMLDRLKAYVRNGGHWIETGGASFFFAQVPYRFCSYEQPYPNLFMDFCSLKGADGATCTLYGVRPRPPHAPWKNPRAFEFVPGTLGCGGDPRGGYVDHAFQIWAAKGQPLKTPAVRMTFGQGLQQAVDAYAAANDLSRPLADKIAPKALDALKKSVLFKVSGGTAAEIAGIAGDLPVPTLVHIAHYLKGGFDKEYPDHLPSNPVRFGTDADHRALIDALRARGHLYSPYTNPTWWCDHPRGPTFLSHSEAPLAVDSDGKPYHEQYSANDGWTITYWHPAVQAANRKTVRQFTQDLPVDLLFQDQCGARRCRYDFNPASPSPTAYTEGLLAMNEEDSRIVPIATEDGWDKVANEQTALCGVSWATVPLELIPKKHTRPLAKMQIPPHLWEFEPLAARLMHTKTLFWMHDLGAFVNNPRIFAWMLATGYNMSYCCSVAHYAANPRSRGWLDWLACVQRTVGARIAGAPLVAWRHDRAPMLARANFAPECGKDDGIVVAQWGDVRCAVNLGDVPRTVEGHRLAPYGFHIVAPDLEAAALEGEDPYVKEGGKTWRFSDFIDTAKFPWTSTLPYW